MAPSREAGQEAEEAASAVPMDQDELAGAQGDPTALEDAPDQEEPGTAVAVPSQQRAEMQEEVGEQDRGAADAEDGVSTKGDPSSAAWAMLEGLDSHSLHVIGLKAPRRNSAYNIFFRNEGKRLTVEKSSFRMGEMAQLVGDRWSAGGTTLRAKYEAMARTEYAQATANYTARRDAVLAELEETFGGSVEALVAAKAANASWVTEDGDVLVHCTVCGDCLGKGGRSRKRRMHPLLRIPVCSSCLEVYQSGEFIISEEDGHEIYCRWCGDGGDLNLCDTCKFSFCSGCITRNFGVEGVQKAAADMWRCFVCDPTPLKELRERHKIPMLRKRPKVIEDLAPPHASHSKRPRPHTAEPLHLPTPEAEAKVAPVMEPRPVAPRLRDLRPHAKVVTEDISLGRERNVKIPCVNEVDDAVPPDFVYIAENAESSSVHLNRDPEFLACCDCTDGCMDATKCACMKFSGRPTATYSSSGRLMEHRAAVYECNARCRCHASCRNRVVGRGIRLPLEVFRCTPVEKGWGVRCREAIPAGTFVACYFGELLDENAVEERGRTKGDEYLFNLDLWAFDMVERRLAEIGVAKGSASRVAPAPDASAAASSSTSVPVSPSTSSMQISGESQEPRVLSPSGALNDEAHQEIREQKGDEAVTGKQDGDREKESESPDQGALDEAPRAPREGPDSDGIDSEARERRRREELVRDEVMTEVEKAGYLLGIDAKWWGSIGRFFNHSCAPNMDKQPVFVDSHDVRVPHLAFFTNSDVPAYTELTYDYGYVKGSVEGKQMICRCGEPGCIERMY